MSMIDHSLLLSKAGAALDGSLITRWWRGTPRSAAPFRGSLTARLLAGKPSATIGVTAVLLLLTFPIFSLSYAKLALFVAVAIAAFLWPRLGAGFLPAALVWSPKLPLALIGDEYMFMRLDHALVLGVCLRLATTKHPAMQNSSIASYLALFLAACAASVTAGLLQGTSPSPAACMLYLVQMVHLALVFSVAYSFGSRLGVAGVYAWALPVLAAACYGVVESHLPLERVSGYVYRTFERGYFDGQANHFAALFVLGVSVGVPLASLPRWRTLGCAVALLSFLALTGVHSREGAAGLAAAVLVLLLLRFPRWTPVILLTGIAVLAWAAQPLWNWASAPGTSLHSRLLAWQSAVSTVGEYPLLGIGLGARHRSYYDNQYIMLLAECGIAGIVLFGVWLAVLARDLDRGAQGAGLRGALCTGALAGLIGICVQSMAASCFVVTVVAGPAYWMCAYALAQKEAPP